MSSTDSMGLEAYLDGDEKESKQLQTSTFLRLMGYVLKCKFPLFMGISMIILGTLATLLEPRIFATAIDDAIIPKRWDRLKGIGAIFTVVTLMRVFTAFQQGFYFELLGQRVTQNLRIRLFSHFQKIPVSTFDKNPAGRLLTRVTNDIASLSEMFSAGFVSMVCNILLVIGILTGMMLLDFKLGIIASSVFPLLILSARYFSRRLKVSYRDARSRLSALNSFLAENLSGMKVVHLFNRQALHASRFENLNQWYADAQVQTIRVFAFFQPTITIAAGLSISLIIWFGGYETLNGELKLGVLVAFFTYVLALFQPVREIADKWNIFLSGMASAERVFSILDWATEYEEKRSSSVLERAKPIEGLRGDIVFENVWFAYEGEKWILRDFSVEIKAGERIGVVGHTGAGKTTLMSLLMRFYEPQKGRILLDGQDIRQYDKRSLRASIGIVQQEVFLFSGTFDENITFWNPEENEKVKKILAHFRMKVDPEKILLERGNNLSMGERQVIAFARALLAHPKIWILDEATSSLDSETEEELQRALDVLSANRTALLIAHRLATVKTADRIFVLHKGSLIESGSHNELMKFNGLYARLYRYQKSQEPSLGEQSLSKESQVVNSMSGSSA